MANESAIDTVVAEEKGAKGDFQPYVPDHVSMPEFTFSAVAAGTLLGIVFGASSIYLVLKTGITVSASIPVAVMSITIFRVFSRLFGVRTPTILENNISQTAGSAGESIAFGVGVTMPVMLLLGFDMEVTRVLLVALLGGSLGILMMIPLRRAFIVKLHGKPGDPGTLLYPEGTACAEVLISGEKGGASGGMIFFGFLVAFCHKFAIGGFNLLKETAEVTIGHFTKSVDWVRQVSEVPSLKQIGRVSALNCSMAPELLGVGFIIGPRVASIMMAGAVLGYLLIVPMIAVFGAGMTTPLPPADKIIAEMSTPEISGKYLRFIGAGCVTAAGIISMFRTLPMIVRSIGAGVGSMGGALAGGRRRTERDMPFTVVVLGSLGLLGLMAAFLSREVDIGTSLLGAGLILVFGFLFVTVSSRLTGEIGSTSNPISGMTVATLSITCLIFVLMGKTSPTERVLALSIAAVVCIAASNGGTTSQDLKTGFLVGGTPIRQQWAILIGAAASALFIGVTLLLFNQAGTVYSQKRENLPNRILDRESLNALSETWMHKGVEFRVWTPGAQEAGVAAGKYLVNQHGKVTHVFDKDFYSSEKPERPDKTLSSQQLAALTAFETHKNEQFAVLDVRAEEEFQIPPGKYLVDSNGRVAYVFVKEGFNADPEKLPTYRMTRDRLAAIAETESRGGTTYKVWRPTGESDPGVTPGKYLVDDAGNVAWLVDPAVTGRLTRRDDGEKVSMKFEAPKTQVMGIIINGVLGGTLNWGLVILGALIAVTLELCGVSSLAFAVGVYIPMADTAPIFLGGLSRYLVDRYTSSRSNSRSKASEESEVEQIAKTETSSGVLLSSGYVAGGTIAAVICAFLQFDLFEDLRKRMNLGVADAARPDEFLPHFDGDGTTFCVFVPLILLLILVGMFYSPKPSETKLKLPP